VFTLCIAIASLGFLAVPSLLNAAMNRQVQERHLYDAGVSTRVLDLTPAQLSAVGHLPGIAAVKARLDAAGYPVTTQEIYVTEAQITAADTTILTIVQILGLLVVAIMLMGLVSAPAWASSSAPARSASCAAWVPGPATSGGSSVRRRWPGRRRLGVRSPARLADLPGAAGADPARCRRRPFPRSFRRSFR